MTSTESEVVGSVGSETGPGVAGSDLATLHRKMLLARFFEEEVQRLYQRNLVRGSTHLGIGQEAVAVGACAALRPGDTVTATYRGHAAALALGCEPEAAFAEILGRATGMCGGKGGSMHLTDVARGLLGSFAIVGANLPITVGAAWAAQYLRDDTVALAFFGDGSTNIGGFHESLNLAGVWRLPAIFVCENNLYGEYSPLATTTPVLRLADRAASYGMPGVRIDGNDVEAVAACVGEAADRARAGDGPTLVEAMTYRQCGHSRSDPGAYRPPGELEQWLKRDPIVLAERLLVQRGRDQPAIDEMRATVEAEVIAAAARAVAAPEPTLDVLLSDVLAGC